VAIMILPKVTFFLFVSVLSVVFLFSITHLQSVAIMIPPKIPFSCFVSVLSVGFLFSVTHLQVCIRATPHQVTSRTLHRPQSPPSRWGRHHPMDRYTLRQIINCRIDRSGMWNVDHLTSCQTCVLRPPLTSPFRANAAIALILALIGRRGSGTWSLT